jgi:hypothetical protein
VLKSPLKFGRDSEEPSIQPDVDVYDIDVFDNSAETIAKLHRLGKKVIGYFSAGTYEKWRPDSRQFGKADLGKPMDDWDERWVDVRSGNVRAIMAKRIQLAAEKGCDAIDPDNVDGYVRSLMFICFSVTCQAANQCPLVPQERIRSDQSRFGRFHQVPVLRGTQTRHEHWA